MKDVPERAGCVEELETYKAQIPALQSWQCLGCRCGKESPPQLYLVFAGVKQRVQTPTQSESGPHASLGIFNVLKTSN